MTEFTTLLQQGNAWFFIPSAILLGALHGLEPGHSKTMMAAFIIAIKGTIKQAVMLGLAATMFAYRSGLVNCLWRDGDQQALYCSISRTVAPADFRSDHYWHRVLDVLAYLARRTQLAGEYARV